MHNAQDVYDEVTKIPPPNGDCHVNHRDSDVLAVGDGHALVSASVCGQESIVLHEDLDGGVPEDGGHKLILHRAVLLVLGGDSLNSDSHAGPGGHLVAMKPVPDQGLAGVHDDDLGPLHADGDGAVLVVDDWLVGVQVVDLCIINALKGSLFLLWMKLWGTKITVVMTSLAKGRRMPKYIIIMAKMPALLYPLSLVQERVEDVIRALCGVTGDSDTLKINFQAHGLVEKMF